MFGSLKKRLKSVFGDAKEESVSEESKTEKPVEKEHLEVKETVETMKGEETVKIPVEGEALKEAKPVEKSEIETKSAGIEKKNNLKEFSEEKKISEDEMKKITDVSLPLTQKPVSLSERGRKIREKMIQEYKKEDKKFKEAKSEISKSEMNIPESVLNAESVADFDGTEKEIDEQDAIGKIDKKTGLLKRFRKAVTEKTLDESDIEPIIEELKNALLENDVALKVAEEICGHVKKQLIESSVPRSKVAQEIKESLKKAMRIVMKQTVPDISRLIEQKPESEPLVVLFLGFNGSGKTTTMAKIAKKYIQYKPVFAAADTFRAASVEQVEKHGERLGVDVVKHQYGADPAAVVFDAIKHAKSIGSRLVLADSAGRTHENVNLIDELKKIVRVNNPDLNILVLDALTGNDIYEQSKKFNEAINVDAIILTKADVYSKGGAALSASHTIGKPIMFLGTGQDYDDLMVFDPDKIVESLLD